MSSGGSSKGPGGGQGYSGPQQSQGRNWDLMMQNLAGMEGAPPPSAGQTQHVGNNDAATDTSGPVSSAEQMAGFLSAVGYGIAGAATGGPLGGLVGGAHGYQSGKEGFAEKSAEKMGISVGDYGLGVKHGTIDAGTGKRRGIDDDDDEGLGKSGGVGSNSGLGSGNMDSGGWE